MPSPIPHWKVELWDLAEQAREDLKARMGDDYASLSRDEQKQAVAQEVFMKINTAAGAQTLLSPLVTQAIANEDTSLTARDNMSAILEAVSERNIASLHANTVSSDSIRVMIDPYMLVNLSAQFTGLTRNMSTDHFIRHGVTGLRPDIIAARDYITPQDVEDDPKLAAQIFAEEVGIVTGELGNEAMDQYLAMIVVMNGDVTVDLEDTGELIAVPILDENGDPVMEADGKTPKIEMQMGQQDVVNYDKSLLTMVSDHLGKSIEELTYPEWANMIKGDDLVDHPLHSQANLYVKIMENSASMHWTQEAQLQAQRAMQDLDLPLGSPYPDASAPQVPGR